MPKLIKFQNLTIEPSRGLCIDGFSLQNVLDYTITWSSDGSGARLNLTMEILPLKIIGKQSRSDANSDIL